MNLAAYDRRFLICFLEELRYRHNPRFPDGPWFVALHRADVRLQFMPPPTNVGGESRAAADVSDRIGYDVVERAEINRDRELRGACNRWLATRDLLESQDWKHQHFSLRK